MLKDKLLLERPWIDHTLPEANKTRGLEVCKCGSKRRGPMGGVCGNCGQAIPSQQEIDFHKIV